MNATTRGCLFAAWLALGVVSTHAHGVSNCAKLLAARPDDPRFALARMTRTSPTLDALDDFSSPALLHTVLLRPGPAREFTRALADRVRASTTLARTFSDAPPDVRLVLDLIEARHRAAIEIGGLVFAATSGHPPELSPADFAASLVTTARAVFAELARRDEYRRVFSNFDAGAVDWNSVSREIARAYEARALSLPPGDPTALVRPRVLGAARGAQDVFETLDLVGAELVRRLDELPVGITHRLVDQTAAVRFGPRLYFGGIQSGYRSVGRDAYVRSGPATTTSEVTLRLSRFKKKMIALRLDRSHQGLDPLFGLERPRGRLVHTCGSFATLLFLRSGVAIVAPAYLTPGASVLSLWLQRALGLRNVECAWTRIPPHLDRLGRDAVTLGAHEIFPTALEVYVTSVLAWGFVHGLL